MILDYEESRKPEDQTERLAYLSKADDWYEQGAVYAHDNGYALLQSVFEGIRGNIRFDRAMLQVDQGKELDLVPAFDQFLEECLWDAHYEERHFFRSLDLLMQRMSRLSSDDIRHYSRYLRENWEQRARAGKLPGEAKAAQPYSKTAATYVSHMERFCQLVEDFSEYIATEQ